MNTYSIKRNPTKIENAFALVKDATGEVVGWYATPDEAVTAMKLLFNDDSGTPTNDNTPEEITTDPAVKLNRSIKYLRQEAIAQLPHEEDTINAIADVAAMIVLSLYRNSEQLERIASALVAQTKILCHFHNLKQSDFLADDTQSDLFPKQD